MKCATCFLSHSSQINLSYFTICLLHEILFCEGRRNQEGDIRADFPFPAKCNSAVQLEFHGFRDEFFCHVDQVEVKYSLIIVM